MPSERGPRGERGERGQTGQTGKTGETGELSRWVVRVAVAAAIFIPLALVAVVVGQKLIYERAESTAQATAEQAEQIAMQADALANQNAGLINTIIEAERQECLDDHEGRVEGRDRAVALRGVTTILIQLAEGAPVAQTNPGLVELATDRLRAYRDSIDVLPLPDCAELSADLREHLSAGALPQLQGNSRGGDANTAPSGGGRQPKHDNGGP